MSDYDKNIESVKKPFMIRGTFEITTPPTPGAFMASVLQNKIERAIAKVMRDQFAECNACFEFDDIEDE